MNRKSLFLLIALLAVIGTWSYFQQGTNGGDYSLVGKEAPDFSLKDEKGNTVRLSGLRGKVVLLHFWATWCPPCVEEIPSLDKMVKKFDPAKFMLLPVSVDEEGADAIKAFRKRVSFSFSAGLNPKADVADLYGVYRLPESLLIDQNGKVVKRIGGPQDWEHPRWEEMINKLSPP
ncbi:MAG: TlpA family protein disulfide reductase [Deltaproteobacteria bacterium]|nr:TlpA family protein disulfide reductase [Deltaproteobacteria bacterium]